MSRKNLLILFRVILASVMLSVLGGCGGTGAYSIRRIEIPLSEVFYLSDRCRPDQRVNNANGTQVGTLKGSSWLADLDDDGVWETVFPTTNTSNYMAGGPGASVQYRGARMTGVDSVLMPRDAYLDTSAYDGMVFRYKSNSQGTIFLYDKSYRFSVPGRVYRAHGYKAEGGEGNPDIEYRELIIPFSNVSRNPVVVNEGTDDNNLENFDRDQLTRIFIDARQPEDSINGVQLVGNSGGLQHAWHEIIDFAFFVYE